MDDSNKSLKELRDLCKQKKIKGITGKSKEQLLALLNPVAPIESEASAQPQSQPTLATPFYTANALHYLSVDKRNYSCIYLDPPYASGRDYKYAEKDSQIAFTDKFTPEQYKEWLTKLIQACKARLTPNGTLWFHIAAEYSFIPEQILQAEFKEVEKVFWKKSHGKNTVKTKMGAVIDILFRCWSGPNPTFHLQYVPLDPYYFEHSYKNKDSRGLYALGSLRFDKTRSGNTYEVNHNNQTYKAPYGWKVKKEEMDRLLAENRIHFVPSTEKREGNLYKKLYKEECKGKPLSNLWDDISYITRTQQDPRTYPTQKPLKLLQRILSISTNPGDWVLDPTAGSGTTGIAASTLERNCVMIDINPEAKKIFDSRLSTASTLSTASVEEDTNLTDDTI